MADLNKDGLQDVVTLSENYDGDVYIDVRIKKESVYGGWYWDDDYVIWADGTGYGGFKIIPWSSDYWHSNVYVGYGADGLIDLAVNWEYQHGWYGWIFLDARTDPGVYSCAWDISFTYGFVAAGFGCPIGTIIPNPYNQLDRLFAVPTLGAIHNISTHQKLVNSSWTHDPITGDNMILGASKNEPGVDKVIPGNPWSVDFSVSPSFTYSLGNEVLYQNGITGGWDKYGNLQGTAKVYVKTTSDTAFTFTPSMSVYADYEDSLRLAKFTVGGSVSTTVGVTATVDTVGHYGYERKLYEYHQFFYQQAGFVPIWEELVIEVYGGFDIDASATGTVTAKAYISGGVTLGGEYERGVGWTGIVDTSFDAYGDVTWSINGNVAVTPYISVRPTVYIYSVVGPMFDTRPYVELKGKHSQTGDTVYDSWTLSGGVKADLNFELRLYGEILSRPISLFDFRTVVAGKSTYTFYSKVPASTLCGPTHYFQVDNGATKITVTLNKQGYAGLHLCMGDPDANHAGWEVDGPYTGIYPIANAAYTCTYDTSNEYITVTPPALSGLWHVYVWANPKSASAQSYTITITVNY